MNTAKIASIHNFFKERNYQEFKILFEDGSLPLESVDNIKELLNGGYKAKKLYEYLVFLKENEGVECERAIGLLNDLRHMSNDMEIDFRPYSKNLKERHDKLQEKYSIKKDKINDEKLKEKFKDFEIKQTGERYFAKLLKSVEDFKTEGEMQKNCVLSYVKRAVSHDLIIFSIRAYENLEKPVVTVEVKDGKIVQARSFANGPLNDEIREYLVEVGYKNNWKVLRV